MIFRSIQFGEEATRPGFKVLLIEVLLGRCHCYYFSKKGSRSKKNLYNETRNIWRKFGVMFFFSLIFIEARYYFGAARIDSAFVIACGVLTSNESRCLVLI